MKELKGWHVATFFGLGFGTIIAVNAALAVSAVRTFPGLEVKNSYVASQSFDANRSAQEALGWDVSAWIHEGQLKLSFMDNGVAVSPIIETATFGRATSVAMDQTPIFNFDGEVFVAPIEVGSGNWNLRITARSVDGTKFQQRIIVVAPGEAKS